MIDIKNVSRTYSDVHALSGINYSIEKGSIVGVVGRNGAGKTTLLKILSGMLTPSDGTVLLNGTDIHKAGQAYKFSVGSCSGHVGGLYMMMSVIDNLKFFASMYHVPKKIAENRAEELLKYFDLQEKRKASIGSLSTGMKLKLKLAIAVIHTPNILILDESTSGMDYEAVQKTLDMIRFLNKECKITVLFTTHKINEIDAVANELIILDGGKIISSGRINQYYTDYKNMACIKAIVNESDKDIIKQSLANAPTVNLYGLEPGKEDKTLTMKVYTVINKSNVNEIIHDLIPGIEIKGIWTEDLDLDSMVKMITERSQNNEQH
jgi:ABC-type multidrug transport system ATPase subunit